MNRPVIAEPAISPKDPDWDRERILSFWSPSRKLLRTVRLYQSARAKPGVFSRLYSKLLVLRYRFWSVITQAEIPLTGEIGGGLILPHPNGIVIHPDSKIGPNCIIFQQATLGTSFKGSGVPVIGGGVEIGAGARVLGPVTIGDNAVIAANAVVLIDVPEGAVAAGIPAEIVKMRHRTQAETG